MKELIEKKPNKKIKVTLEKVITLTIEDVNLITALLLMGYRYLARDIYVGLRAYKHKPTKEDNEWQEHADENDLYESISVCEIYDEHFNFISNTDIEALSINEFAEKILKRGIIYWDLNE